MSHLKKPIDNVSAQEVMKKFPDMAYSPHCQDIFLEAVSILYGPGFVIRPDPSGHMQFCCQICNRDMNSESAVAEHCRSGTHQKNADRKLQDRGEQSYHSIYSRYDPDSLQFKLLSSHVKPLGLQMVEGYDKGKGYTYYKCNLCGAHGKLDTMYLHLIGKRHTEKYIKSACVLQNSVITSDELEDIRHELFKIEGINCQAIKIIRGREYYPEKWEEEGYVSTKLHRKFKEEARSSSNSPSPGPSRSTSGSSHQTGLVSCKRSPDQTHVSSSKRPLKHSPILSLKKSPNHLPKLFDDPWGTTSREKSPLARYRNKSPPHLHASSDDTLQPSLTSSPHVPSLPPPPTSPPPLPPPLPPLPPLPPPSPPSQLVDNRCQGVQKFDLEELMIQLNFIVKTNSMADSDIRNHQDAKLAIDLMFKISDALSTITRMLLDDDVKYTSQEGITKLKNQKTVLSKIMGYVKYRMEEAWNQEMDM
ncbi:uncharacterized protein [Panulirus ornatus]|uniref:uncharacterized protein isoform X1 n=1 Tax=Panulirus ornatus TaxID=150431 RepID=UPI003A8863FF